MSRPMLLLLNVPISTLHLLNESFTMSIIIFSSCFPISFLFIVGFTNLTCCTYLLFDQSLVQYMANSVSYHYHWSSFCCYQIMNIFWQKVFWFISYTHCYIIDFEVILLFAFQFLRSGSIFTVFVGYWWWKWFSNTKANIQGPFRWIRCNIR